MKLSLQESNQTPAPTFEVLAAQIRIYKTLYSRNSRTDWCDGFHQFLYLTIIRVKRIKDGEHIYHYRATFCLLKLLMASFAIQDGQKVSQ